MVGTDKIVHFVVSMILTILFAIAVKSVNTEVAGYLCGIFGGIVTMCIGVGKEIWDKFHGTGFDLMDLVADLGGCVVAVIFSIFM